MWLDAALVSHTPDDQASPPANNINTTITTFCIKHLKQSANTMTTTTTNMHITQCGRHFLMTKDSPTNVLDAQAYSPIFRLVQITISNTHKVSFFTPCSRETHSQLIQRKNLVNIISFLAQKFDGRIPALLLYTQTQSETFFKDVSSKCSCYEPSGFRAKILLSKKNLQAGALFNTKSGIFDIF